MKSTLTQLFWPRNSLNKEGYIIGWSIRGFTCCVITVKNANFASIASALNTMGEKAEVLGIVGKEHELVVEKSQSDIWITAETNNGKINITELHCCGYKYKVNAHIIYFDSNIPNPKVSNFVCPAVFFRKSINYYSKLKKPDLSTFQIVCEKINRCKFVEDLLDTHLGNRPALSKPSKNQVYCVSLILIMKDVAEVFYSLYVFKIPKLNTSLKDLFFRSKFIQQLLSRLWLLRCWESNKNHYKPSYSCPYLQRSYINNYIRSQSALFTILGDFLLGLCILCILYYFSTDTLVIVHTLGSTLHIEVLKSEVNWLMGLPAGFKPNEALDNAFGTNILLSIDYWNYVTTYLTKFEGEIIRSFAIFGLFGISFQLALLSDFIDFCTLHM